MLVILTGLAVGWIRKGKILAMPFVKLKLIWLLFVAYALQHISIAWLHGTAYEVVLVVSYLSILGFCVVNWRVPGVIWNLAGTAANFLVMSVNGLRMPAYLPAARALDAALVPALIRGQYAKSVAMSTHTHLNFLGDIFSFAIKPASLISVGDILFAIGLVILIQHAMRSEGGPTGNGVQAETAH